MLGRVSCLILLGGAITGCPYGKEQLAAEYRESKFGGCAKGEVRNHGYESGPCQPERSRRALEPCSFDENCAEGLYCEEPFLNRVRFCRPDPEYGRDGGTR